MAVALNPTSTIAIERSAVPPSWTNGKKGPCAWPNATEPHGKPPKGTIDFNHSWAVHTSANQTGQPGSCRTSTAHRPKIAGNSAHVIANTVQGTAPTSVLIQGSSGR